MLAGREIFVFLRPFCIRNMKKIVIFVLSVVLMLLSGSCERMVPEGLSHADEQVLRDFRIRYPKAGIAEISNWDEGSTEIHFTDADGLDGVAIYLGETWMITEKTLYEDDFLFAIPRRVARTYVGTGIENEDYSSDYSYIVEVSRNGLDKKQYEFHCVAPFADGSQEVENLRYSIIIDEDGTLLECSHSSFNRSVWWYDIRSSIACVKSKYGDVPILGAVNDAGNNVLFIRDHGNVKTVTMRDNGYGIEWVDTRYPLDMNTVLPASVLADKEQYEAAHPGQGFYALSSVDRPEGLFYGLTFGTVLTNTTIFSPAK